ncbi:sugar MFS transporter [Danxiaibacter flavus]|uniref:Sugar MFS transporter n=1 Tax=Danxiaibacter flavus TaxID=3049108 RepID=A0ABV3ZLZ5_9BACT|nr:sugar MFS transporter [Chitinophagaceae bacterium DXS]
MKLFNKPIFIIGMLFFVFGFVTWLGAVLIPYLRIACQLNDIAGYLVAFSFYISYAVMAIPAASVLRLTGYKKGMSIGLLIMAAGAALFIPAAFIRSYPLFLTGLFVQGTGLAILQTASNPYITILGPHESAARRISVMGICSGIASVIGPLLIGAVILQDADGVKARIATMSAAEKTIVLSDLAHRVIVPYLIIVVVLVFLAMLVFFSGLPEVDADAENETVASANNSKTSIFQFPHLLLGVCTLFLYVGVEVIAGDTIVNYASSQGISLSVARFFASCTQVCMLAGYIIGIIAIPKYISQVRALKISPVAGLLFAGIALFTNGLVSVTFIALLGLANSLIWPSIWPLAINGLGRFTKIGSSLLIIAIGGGAILPLVYGWLAHIARPQQAYWLVIPCYLSIWLYAKTGHKVGLSLKHSA